MLAWLVSEPRDLHVSASPAWKGNYSYIPPHMPFLTWVLEDHIQVFMLVRQALYRLSHLSSSQLQHVLGKKKFIFHRFPQCHYNVKLYVLAHLGRKFSSVGLSIWCPCVMICCGFIKICYTLDSVFDATHYYLPWIHKDLLHAKHTYKVYKINANQPDDYPFPKNFTIDILK